MIALICLLAGLVAAPCPRQHIVNAFESSVLSKMSRRLLSIWKQESA